MNAQRRGQPGMSLDDMKSFIRNHFEEFVNRKNLVIADVNFAPDFVDHGAGARSGLPPGPAIEEMIAEHRGYLESPKSL